MDERERPQNTRKVPINREGVTYIPGGHLPGDMASREAEFKDAHSRDAGLTRKIRTEDLRAATEKKTSPVVSGPKVRQKGSAGGGFSGGAKTAAASPVKRTNYAVIIVTVIFVAVLAAVFVFASMLGGILGNNSENSTGGNSGLNGQAGPPVNGPGTVSNDPPVSSTPANPHATIGLIRDIRSNRLDIYIFDISETRSFFAEAHSNLRDRFGNAITLPQFAIGDVVEITHAATSNAIEVAQLSAQVRYYREITDVMVENDTVSTAGGISGNMLVIGNRRYSLSEQPIVRYRGETAEISALDPIDLVTIGIFQDRYVTAIDIHRSHGDILIPHNPDILGGIVEVGNSVITALAGDDMIIKAPAGENRVVIRGDNIEPFIFEANVQRGLVAALNFEGLKFRSGTLTVRTTVQDAVMYIDERWYALNEAVSLEYGSYTMTITAPGHQTFEQTIQITAEPQELTPTLIAITHTRSITIGTSPTEVRVYIDGEFKGLTPLTLELELRRHSLRLERMGFIGSTTDIHITETSLPTLNYILAPDPAWRIFE